MARDLRLSEGQATRCENATAGRCRCRCGGKLHGARRVERVADLPPNDPHAPARKEVRDAS